MAIITQEQKRKAVARWLLLGVAMLIIQILLGGITRLTGSGLSITEWKPILGAVPPMSEPAWQAAFEKYKQSWKWFNPTINQYISHIHRRATSFVLMQCWEV